MMPFPRISRGKLDDQNGVFTGQTHQDHQPHLHEDVVYRAPVGPDTKQRGEHHRHDGITIAAGSSFHSAASTENASSTATGKTISAVLQVACC